MIFGKKLTLHERYQEIAEKKRKVKKEDFILNPKGKSLIHFAARYDNLELLKSCIANGQSVHIPCSHNDNVIKYSFIGHSFSVLKYLEEEYLFNFSSLDNSGEPLWWAGFGVKNKSAESVESLINFIKSKVDFNVRASWFKSTIAHKLHSNYNFQNLLLLVKHTDYDVNSIAREDLGVTLSHLISHMEDSRFAAFQKEDPFIIECYKTIIQQADLYSLDKEGRTIVDRLCFSGRKTLLKLIHGIRKIKLTPHQQLLLASCSLGRGSFHYNNDELVERGFGDYIYYKKSTVDNIMVCEGEGLVFGRDDKEIEKHDCITLTDLRKLEKVVLNNGYELFKVA